MSGRRQLWPTDGGYPVVDVDLQAMADAAAGADDLAWEALLRNDPSGSPPSSGSYGKRVVPLDADGRSASYPQHTLVLAFEDPASLGTIEVKPALFAAMGATYGAAGVLIGSQQAALVARLRGNSTPLPIAINGDAVNWRNDLVYAAVTRGSVATVARLIKSTVDGTTSTQNVTVATDPVVTIVVATGTPSGSPVVPTLPTDTGTAQYFPLAVLVVPPSYAGAGTGLLASGGKVTQVWRRGGVTPRARADVRLAKMTDVSGLAQAGNYPADETLVTVQATPLGWGAFHKVAIQVEHTGAATAILDDSVFWSYRAARFWVTLMPFAASGGDSFRALPLADVPGGAAWDSGWVFTGKAGGSGGVFDIAVVPASGSGGPFGAATTGALRFRCDSTGRLTLTFDSTIVGGLTGPGRYFVMAEFSDRFINTQTSSIA